MDALRSCTFAPNLEKLTRKKKAAQKQKQDSLRDAGAVVKRRATAKPKAEQMAMFERLHGEARQHQAWVEDKQRKKSEAEEKKMA